MVRGDNFEIADLEAEFKHNRKKIIEGNCQIFDSLHVGSDDL